MRSGWLIALLLVAMLLPFGCSKAEPSGEPAETEDETINVAWFGLVRANEYEQSRGNGMRDKIKKDNLNVELFEFFCEYDPIEQVNQIKDAIAAGKYHVFCIWPMDSNAVVPVIEEAIDAGIIVIGADGPIGPDVRSLEPYPEGVLSMVGRTGYSQGSWLGRAVVQAAEGMEQAKVAYLIGSQGFTVDQERFAGVEDAIKDHPHIEIASFQEGEYRRDISFEVMQDVFEAQPDINIVVSSGDQMTLGAEDAAKAAGLEGIKFIGNGCSVHGWEALKEGRWFASYADIPYTQGEVVIEVAWKAARGEEVPRSVNLEDLRPPLPAAGPLITPADTDSYEAQW